MLMEKKVCFPCYRRCEFDSLQEAVDFAQQMPGGLSVYIAEIVLYNIRFRDCLREKGVEGVIKMLIHEAPAISGDSDALKVLRRKWSDGTGKRVADYDIQCMPKNHRFHVLDCWFDGLGDVDSRVEISGNPRHTFLKWHSREAHKQNLTGLHIGNIWEGYPVFDSSDGGDDRSYNNYVFSRTPLTEDLMEQYCKRINSNFNACMVHEDIPVELLPILYYNGDSDWVILASAKPKKKWYQIFSRLIS